MARKIITDEESKLKRQARRRLIGAIALTIPIVVLLITLLDKEPPAPQQDIELQIPDKDKVGEFVPKMVLPPLTSTASIPASATVIVPLLDVKPVLPAKTEVKPLIEAASSATESKPLVNLTPKSAPVSNVKVEPEAKPASKPVVKPVVIPAVKPVEKSGVRLHSGFVVQVGAFADADKAKKLMEKLRKQGYPSYTETAGGKTRVRIGDYANQAEADKIRRKLEIQGMQTNVVNLK